jgi:hypothetical protein
VSIDQAGGLDAPESQRWRLAAFATQLLAQLELRVWPTPGGFEAAVMGVGAYDQAVLELVAALTSPKGAYRCDSCGCEYTPDGRRPSRRSKRRHYCPECRDSGEAKRSRERKRHERRTTAAPAGA